MVPAKHANEDVRPEDSGKDFSPNSECISQPLQPYRSPLIFVSVRVFRGRSVCIGPAKSVLQKICRSERSEESMSPHTSAWPWLWILRMAQDDGREPGRFINVFHASHRVAGSQDDERGNVHLEIVPKVEASSDLQNDIRLKGTDSAPPQSAHGRPLPDALYSVAASSARPIRSSATPRL